MATRNVPPFGDELREFEPDRDERARHFAKLKVLDECDRRIRARYPLDRQIQIIAARQAVSLARSLSSDARHLVETDASSLVSFIECVALHRLAAQSLCRAIDDGSVDPRKVKLDDDAYWSVSHAEEERGRDAGADEAA